MRASCRAEVRPADHPRQNRLRRRQRLQPALELLPRRCPCNAESQREQHHGAGGSQGTAYRCPVGERGQDAEAQDRNQQPGDCPPCRHDDQANSMARIACVALRPRRAQPVSGHVDVSCWRTVLMWAALIRRSRPSGSCTRINGTRPVRRSPIARSIWSTVSCTSSSSPSMNWITDAICPATTPTLFGGESLSESHFSSSRNCETGMSSGIRPLPRQVRHLVVLSATTWPAFTLWT